MAPRAMIEVRDLVKHFRPRGGLTGGRDGATVKAVDGVSFEVFAGETLGIVGESGCGKSTLVRTILGLTPQTSGSVRFDGVEISSLRGRRSRQLRRRLQVVFQDPYASLNPRRRAGQIVGEPLRVLGEDSRKEVAARVAELFSLVGLRPEYANRFPHQFSGGQRQRIGIARALAVRPEVVIADEPVSALDVSIQAQIVNLLADLQRELGLTYVFVSHDLGVVRHLSDRVAVMYLGKIVEIGAAEEVYTRPRHPYSALLISAGPSLHSSKAPGRRPASEGELPSPANPPSGCRFHTRCAYATSLCATVEPPLTDHGHGHLAACHHPDKTRLETAR